jgi:ATP-dependent Zn protease
MDRRADGTQEQATAYHEAGHAVVALALGRPVAGVSIRPDREALGLCQFGKAVFRPSEDWVEREILIALAGLAAEARHTGEYAWDAAGRDWRYAASLAADRAGNDRKAQRLLRRHLAKVENVLGRDENWRAVERMAAELLRLGEISGRAARHLYEESLRQSR